MYIYTDILAVEATYLIAEATDQIAVVVETCLAEMPALVEGIHHHRHPWNLALVVLHHRPYLKEWGPSPPSPRYTYMYIYFGARMNTRIVSRRSIRHVAPGLR